MPQTIKLKRSSTAGQAPTTAQLDFGELAINTSDGKVYLRKSDGQGDVIIELGGSIATSAATVTSSATAPTNPTPASGNLWYDTINDVLMMYDGAAWQEVAHELSALQVNGNTILGDNAAADTLTVNAIATFSGTDGMVIPSGTSAQRVTANTGTIRYNTDTSSFEGYSGTSWGSLGGVKDVDQDTYITTEASAGSDEDTFTFYAANNVNATWTSSLLDINTAVNIDGALTTTSTGTFGNAAGDTQTFNGAVDMNNTLNVDGNTTVNNFEIGDGNSFTFGSGSNRVAFTDTTRMTVSNEAGTIIFDGRIFTP